MIAISISVPKSIPISLFVDVSFSISVSTNMLAKYIPNVFFDTVIDFIVPLISLSP